MKMLKFSGWSLWAALLLFIVSCSTSENGSNGQFSVKGKITNATGKMLRLETFNQQNQSIFLDSVVLDDAGDFNLHIKDPALGFFRLSTSLEDFAILVLDSTNTPYVEGQAGGGLFKNYAVTGSTNSELLVEFYRKADQYDETMKNLRAQYGGLEPNDTASKVALQDRIIGTNNAHLDYLHNFVDQHASSPAVLSVIRQLDPKSDLAYFKKAKKGLDGTLTAQSVYVRQLGEQIASVEKTIQMESFLAPGTMAPELNYATPAGEPLPLSSLKGKVVLIDFWASWCKPCRIENPNVVKLFNKYKDSGFDIYGVSLDQNSQRWVQAIDKDGLKWNHVSDLKGWQSQAAAQYGVRSIPFTVLIDGEGKVIATKLRGPQLEAKLAEIFGF